jgi:hypothetical protein
MKRKTTITIILLLTLTLAASTAQAQQYPTIGETVEYKGFEVTLNDAYTTPKIDLGNEYLNEQAGKESVFLVAELTFENVSSAQRTAPTGYMVFIDREKEKQYTVEQPVTVLHENWGMIYEQVSPLSTFTTKLAYKFPKGEYSLIWALGRNTFFWLGEYQP